MIKGDKPSGYFTTFDGDGFKIEGETRQCAHCQYIWTYAPGSGTTRGYCTSCNGLICARQECLRDQEKKVEIMGKNYNCVPYGAWHHRMLTISNKAVEKYGSQQDGFTMTDSGLIIPK